MAPFAGFSEKMTATAGKVRGCAQGGNTDTGTSPGGVKERASRVVASVFVGRPPPPKLPGWGWLGGTWRKFCPFCFLAYSSVKFFFTLSQFLLDQRILRLVLCLQGHNISLNPRLVFQSELKYSWSTLFVICSKLVQLFQIITFSELLI